MKTFRDKVAVVTGGGGTGIGNALVVELAKRGAHVAYCDLKGLEKTQNDLVGMKVQTYCETADIGKKEEVLRFAERVIQQFGRVDLLINNAGIASGDLTFDQLKHEDFEKITDINYWGVVRSTMAFYPYLLQSEDSALVNISSTQGILPAPFLVSYCTTKFAVRGFTDSLRVEHQIRGIKNMSIHTVHPGGVATNISLNAPHQGPRTQQFHELLQKKGVSPQHAAGVILKGILRNKSRIFISDGRAQDLIARLMPGSVHHLIKLLMRSEGIDSRSIASH